MPSKNVWIGVSVVVIIAVVTFSALYATGKLPQGVTAPPTSFDVARCIKRADSVTLKGDMQKIFESGEASEKTRETFVDKQPGTYQNEGFYRFEFLKPRKVSLSLPFSRDPVKVESGTDLRMLPVNAPLSLMEVDYVRGNGGTLLLKSGKKFLISNNAKQRIAKTDRIQSIALREGERVTVFLDNVCRKSRYVTFIQDTDASTFNVCAYASDLFTSFTIE